MGKRGAIAGFFIVDFNDAGNWIAIILITLLLGFSIWIFTK